MPKIVSKLAIRVFGSLFAVVALAGCKSSRDPGPPGCFPNPYLPVVWTSDPGALTPGPAPDAAGFATADHPPFPHVTSFGGRTFDALRLVTVVAAGDPLHDELMAFGDALVTSHWLATVGADYGIAPTGTNQHLDGPALQGNVTYDDMQAYVRRAVAASGSQLGTAASPSLYLLYLPPGAQFATRDGVNCACDQLLGAHNALDPNNALAFVQRCPGSRDLTSVAASHEIIEALTDPDIGTGFVLPANAPANHLTGGEVGDLCPGSHVEENGWLYQRVWSNSAAQAGSDPCVPTNPAPYFDVSAAQDWYAASPGETIQIPLTAWSTAPRPDWYLLSFLGSNVPAGMSATVTTASSQMIDGASFYSVNNGQTATLSVTLPAKIPDADLPLVVGVLSLSADSRDEQHELAVGIALDP